MSAAARWSPGFAPTPMFSRGKGNDFFAEIGG